MQLLSCSFLTGPATKQSKIVRLQLLPCSPLAGPAATKISSSQIAVATLQLSCWACRPKNLKQSDCSCCPAALLLGLPPQKSQVRRVQLLSCSLLTGPATKKSKIVRLQLLPCSPLLGLPFFFLLAGCNRSLGYRQSRLKRRKETEGPKHQSRSKSSALPLRPERLHSFCVKELGMRHKQQHKPKNPQQKPKTQTTQKHHNKHKREKSHP